MACQIITLNPAFLNYYQFVFYENEFEMLIIRNGILELGQRNLFSIGEESTFVLELLIFLKFDLDDFRVISYEEPEPEQPRPKKSFLKLLFSR